MISRDVKSNASSIFMQHKTPPQKMEVQQEQSVKKQNDKAQSNFQKLKQSVHPLEAANKLTANFFLFTFNSLEKYPTDEYLPNRQHLIINFLKKSSSLKNQLKHHVRFCPFN